MATKEEVVLRCNGEGVAHEDGGVEDQSACHVSGDTVVFERESSVLAHFAMPIFRINSTEVDIMHNCEARENVERVYDAYSW